MAARAQLIDEERLTREQTSHTALEMDGPESGEWAPTPFTSAPPPNPGMEQRWVRCRLGTGDDVQNMLKRRQQGWEPRPVSTLPPGFAGMVQQLGKQFGDQGSIIGNQDCILMERPLELGRKVRAYYAGQNRRLSESIRDYLGQNLPRQHGTRGGSVDELEMSVTTGNGRRPQRAPD